MRFWFSRAASHSDNYVEVARFNGEEDAKKALNALKKFIEEKDEEHTDYDWDKNDARCDIDKDWLYFSVFTAGYGLDEVESIIIKNGGSVIASGAELCSITFTIEKPSWNEVKATIMVINLLHNKVLDPESYEASRVEKKKKNGKCIWSLEVITDCYDQDLNEVRGESLDELKKFGIDVSVVYP